MNHPHSTNPAAALAALFPGHPATALSNVQIQLQPETAPSLHQAQSLHQWPLQFPSMTVPLHPPPLQQPVVAVQNLAALATALQPYMNAATQSAPPVGLVANDEEILVKALKDARAQGLTPRQALERLHGVNGHSEMDWKNYFLEHLAQLCGKAYPPETTHAGRSQLHNPMASRSDGSLAKNATSTTTRTNLDSSRRGLDSNGNSGVSRHGGTSHKDVTHIAIKKPQQRSYSESVESSSEPESDDDDGYSSDSSTTPAKRSTNQPKKRKRRDTGKEPTKRRPQAVTEEDLRAMARYIYSRAPGPNPSQTLWMSSSFWRDFASRKENAQRRSLNAWWKASSRKADQLESYVEELAEARRS